MALGAADRPGASAASACGRANPPPTSALNEPARQADTVQRAYDLLLDRFVHPLSPAALVGAAWEQLEREAAEQQAPAPGPAPTVSDDRAADSVALRTALVAYLARPAAAWPPAFVPAYAAIRGMARLAAEHHTYFLDPARYRDEQAWASGVDTFGGIGVQLQGPRSTIIDVDEGTPAARAGLVPGDELVRVDGVDVAGLPPLRVAELVRGPLGSSVELVVRRQQAEALATLQLPRERIQLPAVALQELGDVGYIRLRGFAEPSVVGALEQGVSTLQDQGAQGLVIDLRDNPGGRLDVGARLLGDFLPAGTALYQQVDRSGA